MLVPQPKDLEHVSGVLPFGLESVLAFLPILPAALSVAGSCTIMRLVYRGRFRGTYKRILFGMSVCDVIHSVAFVLQPFLVPKIWRRRWAMGNTATCSMMGFFWQFSLSSAVYSCMLSFYFLCTICFHMKEKKLVRQVEPFMHALAVLLPLANASGGAGYHMYAYFDLGMGCWVAGESASHVTFAWVAGGVPYLLCLVAVLVFNTFIYRHVWRTTRRSKQHAVSSGHAQRSAAVATQAFLYVVAYWITWIWFFLARLLEFMGFRWWDEKRLFPFLVLLVLFSPLQGAFNLLIYLRPRYQRLRSRLGDDCRGVSFWQSVQVVLRHDSTLQQLQALQKDPGSSSCRAWTMTRVPHGDKGDQQVFDRDEEMAGGRDISRESQDIISHSASVPEHEGGFLTTTANEIIAQVNCFADEMIDDPNDAVSPGVFEDDITTSSFLNESNEESRTDFGG